MSEKSDTDRIRFSQVASGALAAITAAVLGSTMGVAGTVAGAGLASVVTTVGGSLYLRSIHRTKESVRSLVVTRVGGTDVTVVDEKRTEPAPEADTATMSEPEKTMEQAAAAVGKEAGQDGDEQPPARRRLRWPVLIAASVLAFVLGMLVVTGVELLRGKTLSGDEGTTIGRVAQADQRDGGDPDKAPPPSEESTTPPADTPTETVPPTAPTSENEETVAPTTEPTEPETTEPETTTEAPPPATESVPQGNEVG